MSGRSVAERVQDALRRLESALSELTNESLYQLSREELLTVLRQFETLRRRMPVLDHALVGELEARCVADTVGARTTQALLRDLLRLSPGEANGRVQAARRLGSRETLTGDVLPPAYPAAAAAQAEGEVSAARRKLLHTWWPRLVRSGLGDRFQLFRGFGNESLTADTGSRLELLSATESAGHGETTSLVIVDEAWVHQDATVEQSVRPTMVTVGDAQLWAMSTSGTARSVWWREKLEGGRAAAQMGVDTGLATLEWAADPGADPTAEATWWSCMPALGRLADVDTVRQDLASMGVKEFRRAYCNLWPDEADTGWAVLPRELWAELQV